MCIFGYLFDPCLENVSFLSCLPFMPYRPTPNNEINFMKNEKWMEYVASVNGDARIRDMVIPATHDVGTYGIPKLLEFSSSAITQRLNVYNQLRGGSRNLDLRYGGRGEEANEVFIYHGPYRGPQYEDVFQQIRRFLNENPKEFVVVTLQREQKINEAQKQYIVQLVQKYLTPTAICSEDDWFTPDTATLNQTIAHGKNLFVLADGGLMLSNTNSTALDFTDYPQIGIFSFDLYYQSKWADVNTVADLFSFDLSALKTVSKQPNTFHGSQMILTLQTQKTDIFDYIVGSESLRVDHFTKMLQKNQAMAKFYVQHIDMPFNFVELDFIDYNPNLVKFFIGLNFPQKLTVISASVGKRDVTALVEGLVSRNRCLYLPDMKETFGLKSLADKFHIEFIYQGDTRSRRREFLVSKIDNQFLLTYLDISAEKPQKVTQKQANP